MKNLVLSHNGRVATSLTLHPDILGIVMAGEVLVGRIRSYISPEAARHITQSMKGHPLAGQYSNAPIQRVFRAFYESNDDPELREEYFRSAPGYIEEVRKACLPFSSPMDKLLGDLNKYNRDGAGVLATTDTRQMFYGLVRSLEDGSQILPHTDDLANDAPPGLFPELTHQLAANIYLSITPRIGGELELWDTTLTQEEYAERQLPDSYGLDRSKLPAPALTVKPEWRDLLLFNSKLVHAVRVSQSLRLTTTCFIGRQRSDRKLVVWS